MNLDLNMKDVKLLSWTTTSEITTGAIMIGTNGEPTVNLKMEDCSFDVSGATGSAKAIYANDKASGTINLINTKITSKMLHPARFIPHGPRKPSVPTSMPRSSTIPRASLWFPLLLWRRILSATAPRPMPPRRSA